MKTQEQMRESFSDWYEEQTFPPNAEQAFEYALSQFEAYKEELRAEVKKLDEDSAEEESIDYGWTLAIDAVLTLLSTPVPEGEVIN